MDQITDEERRRIAGLVAGGAPPWKLHQEINRSRHAIRRAVVAPCRPAEREPQRSPLRLSPADREEISRGLAAGQSVRAIARSLRRAPPAVCREVAASGGPGRYRACAAGPAGGAAAAPAEAGEAGPVPAAARDRGGQAGAVLAAAADRGLAGTGLSARPGAARAARDDLPVAVRAGQGRAAEGTDPLPAHRPGPPPAAGADREQRPGQDPRHGEHLRAPRRSRRPGRCPATGRAASCSAPATAPLPRWPGAAAGS